MLPLTNKDISDPSKVLNYVDKLRELQDRVDAEQARWLENECSILESRVHETYTCLLYTSPSPRD